MTTETEFDQVFEKMDDPEYPATCDQCGMEGTNATMENHACNEPPAPRAGERERVKHSPLPWRHQTEDGTLGTIVDADENVIAQTQQVLNDPHHVTRQGNAAFIVNAVNQHATLIEQRERLVKALKMMAHNAADGSGLCWCEADDRVFGHQRKCTSIRRVLNEVKSATATIEREGEASR